MNQHNLTSNDHIAIAFYALLIWCSLKVTMSEYLTLQILGWFLVWMNIKFFDVYAWKRRGAD